MAMNIEITKMITFAVSSYLSSDTPAKIVAARGNGMEFSHPDLPDINLIAYYIAPSRANLKHKIVINRYRYKKLIQLITMQMGRNTRTWLIERAAAATSQLSYLPLIPIKEKKEEPKMNTNKSWTIAESNRLLNMYAIQTSAVDPEEIDYDSLVEQFGKDAFERSEAAINTRLYIIRATLAVNKGILPESYYNQAALLDDFRNKLKEWNVPVWEGEWTKKAPPKKLELDDLISEYQIMKLGSKIAMSVEDLEKLIEFLQG